MLKKLEIGILLVTNKIYKIQRDYNNIMWQINIDITTGPVTYIAV